MDPEPDAAAAEAALVRAARENPAAFGALYQRYVTPVYRYLYCRVGSAAEAEDLTAQVFLQALEGIPRYHHRGQFAAWLFTIARRRAADLYRRQPITFTWEDLVVPSDEDDPVTQAIQAENLEQLRALVAALDEHDLDLLRLRYAAGLTFAQIAATLGRREGAVKMQLQRLLARLRARWEANDA